MYKRPQKRINAAIAFLRSHMTPGQSYDAGELLEVAKRDGHAERTVQLAAEKLSIEKTRAYGGGSGVRSWRWVLPDEADDPALALIASD